MISDKSKAAIVLLGVPLVMLVLSISFVILSGHFDADPDYAYLLNGLNILHFQGSGHADHPGTPVQLLGGAAIGVVWLVRWVTQGQIPLDEDVLRHPEVYLACINMALALLTASALSFFGRQVRLWTGSFAAAIVGQTTLLLSMPVLISLPRVTPEPLLVSLTILLAALLTPAISNASFPWQQLRYSLLVGATIGASVATKMTAAPLILMIAMLRGVRMQIAALIAAVVIAILLTLPAASLYPALLRWVLELATHSGQYGEGSVGPPALSELFAHLKLLFDSFPFAFVAVAVCDIMLLVVLGTANPDRRPQARLFVVCGLVISVQLLAVAKQYSLRYAVPAAAILALVNAAVVYAAMGWRKAKRTAFAVAVITLLGLGTWHVWRAVSDWYGTSYASSKEKDALMTQAAGSGCLLVPYYGASSKEYNLYFGNARAKSRYTHQLAAIYPNFLTYDEKQFGDFVGVLTQADLKRRFSEQKCVYIFGSPVERFNRFDIPASELIPIARSRGNSGEALAIFQVSSKFLSQ